MPRPEVVKKALDEIRKRDANYQYFFDQLNSPGWIEPLFSEGMFQDPRPPKREGGYISFPFWPESRYLARMAPSVPEMVLDVILKMPETENVRVHEDLANAACAMPPELAAHWARRETGWVKSQQHIYLLLPEELGELISHLARGGQVEAALELAASLLTVFPDPRVIGEVDEEDTFRISPEPRARFDAWYYEQILKKYIPDLVTAAGVDALTLLCGLLEDATRFSRRHKEDDGPEDYSYIWRPAIEDHDQNRRHGLNGLLVSAVRDTAEALMETKGKAALKIVEGRPFKVFKRIGLHLRRKWPEVDSEGTASLVADPNVFDDFHLHHEYFHLLREQFDSLPPKSRQAYLALVEKRVDLEQYTKLWPIQEFLDQEWQQRFDALKQEFGELDHPDFHFYVGTFWTGPTSPKEFEDLRSMSTEKLISFLKTWQPSGDPMSPSPEGLGRELTALVASEPERLAAEARQFQGLDPTYVGALFWGLLKGPKKAGTFPWAPVLDLCGWVVNQSQEIPEREGEYAHIGGAWGPTRRAIASLLSSGFEPGTAEMPFSLRTAAWKVLKPLTDDPDPTPGYEARYGGSNMDPPTLSINTTRGEAMHALVRYALWVRRHLKEAPNGKERIARGFDEIPEVREILDHHLDPDNDPALAIRSVYGRWFPWLVWLDPHWAAQSVTRIFPTKQTLRELRDAAWETYVTFCTASDNVFDLLREEYGRAVEQIGTAASERQRLADPDRRLAEHLMTLYRRGKLSLDEPEGLLMQFYAKASDSLCSYALAFVGGSLHSTEEEIAPQILDGLKLLWERRLNAARSATPPTSHIAELAAFGWWFVSGKFDNEWAIAQLKEALKLAVKVDPDHLVVERLATLAAAMPTHAVECLSLIIEGDKEGWHIHAWREHTRTILSTALQSTDDTARQAAVDLVHRLGARGYLAFRDLLSERGP